jgi:hypothetical protein
MAIRLTDRRLKTNRLDLMPNFFQSAVAAHLARGMNPRGSGLTWLFQVNTSSGFGLAEYACPPPAEGIAAVADRSQLDPIGSAPAAARTLRGVRGFALTR